ncbi:MAG: regulatory iron-sulfur-containing complex subunit RicT [Candidatus Hydrogenedentota bacterium]
MQLVRVRLRKPRRVFTFLSYDLVLSRDDACIVQSDRGLEWGTVILPPEPVTGKSDTRISMRVIRRVNEEDEQNRQKLQEEEERAYKVCLGKMREHKMPMKLVDVEYTFDKKKIIFYFTAEDRVDFRDLVRDLAHDLKTRIELRHIQVRDEAKMVGGIGSCGRELCCSTWLNEFKPISMRMAKRQNLALNPSKISGQCGRLLCCLSYENEMYEELKKRKKAERETKRRTEEEGESGAEPPSRDKGNDRPEPAEAATQSTPEKPAQAPPPGNTQTGPAASKDERADQKPGKRRSRGGRRRNKSAQGGKNKDSQ